MRVWRFALAALAFLAGDAPAQAERPHRNALKIAGVSLGMPEDGLAARIAPHGFAAMPPADPKLARKQAARAIEFARSDGHSLRVEIAGDDPPSVRHLAYRMGGDIDAHARLFAAIRSAYGPPHAEYGDENSLRVLIWEIPGAEMTAEGVIATSIVLTSDPIEGHSLTLGEVRQRPRAAVAPPVAGAASRGAGNLQF